MCRLNEVPREIAELPPIGANLGRPAVSVTTLEVNVKHLENCVKTTSAVSSTYSLIESTESPSSLYQHIINFEENYLKVSIGLRMHFILVN